MLRPDSRAWFSISTFLSTVLAVILTLPIEADNSVTKSIIVTAVASLLSAVFFILLDYAARESMTNARFRSKFDQSRSQFEGEWIEFYKNPDESHEIFYAYFRIRYTGNPLDPYLLKGNAYDSNGRNIAKWDSNAIRFDGHKGIIEYFYSGYLFNKQQSVRGIGNLNFNDETSYAVLSSQENTKDHDKVKHKTRLNSGTGYFVDSSTSGTARNRFHFVRVTNEITNLVLGDGKISNFDAERLFVLSFHKKFSKCIIENDYLLFKECVEE